MPVLLSQSRRPLISIIAITVAVGMGACKEEDPSGNPELRRNDDVKLEPATMIHDAPSCPACRITWTKVTTLGKSGDRVPLGLPETKIFVDSRGTYYAYPLWKAPGMIGVFASDGRVSRTFAHRGRGPNEIPGSGALTIGPGDTIHAIVGTHKRFLPNGQMVQTHQFSQGVSDLHMYPDGRWIGLSPRGDRSAAFRFFSAKDSVLRAFGNDSAPAPMPAMRGSQLLAVRGAHVWRAYPYFLDMEQWDTTGKRLAILRWDAPWAKPWFPDSSTILTDIDEVHPQAQIVGIREDDKGRVWVFTQLAKANWKPGPRRRIVGGQKVPIPWDEVHKYVDTRIDVIDVAKGALIASARLPFQMLQTVGDDAIVVPNEDADGTALVDIYRVTLAEQ